MDAKFELSLLRAGDDWKLFEANKFPLFGEGCGTTVSANQDQGFEPHSKLAVLVFSCCFDLTVHLSTGDNNTSLHTLSGRFHCAQVMAGVRRNLTSPEKHPLLTVIARFSTPFTSKFLAIPLQSSHANGLSAPSCEGTPSSSGSYLEALSLLKCTFLPSMAMKVCGLITFAEGSTDHSMPYGTR